MKLNVLITLLFFSFSTFSQSNSSISINEIRLSFNQSWIEFYNNSEDKTVLKNAYLSDNINKLKKWKIKHSVTTNANGFFILKLDSHNLNNFNGILDFRYNTIHLSVKDTNGVNVIDEIDFHKLGNAKYCRIPDGTGKLYQTKKLTPGAENKLREFLVASVRPNFGLGGTYVNLKQTDIAFNTKIGLFNTKGIDFTFNIAKRYRAVFGLNYTGYKFSFDGETREEKLNGYTIHLTKGSQKSSWGEFKLPFLYNSIRVYDDVYFDFGFLMSYKRKEIVNYTVDKEIYNVKNELTNTSNMLTYYSDNYQGGGSINMPLILRASYNFKDRYEFYTTYYLRKDMDNEIEENNRNLKSAVYFGFAYNFIYLRLR